MSSPPLPAPYADAVHALVDQIRRDFEQGARLETVVFVVNTATGAAMPVQVATQSEFTKDMSVLAIRAAALQVQADLVVTLIEAWGLETPTTGNTPEERQKSHERYREIIARYGSLAKYPDRIDFFQVTVETPEGVWMAADKIRPRGKKGRTFGDMPFYFDPTPEGRFIGVLPPPPGAAS